MEKQLNKLLFTGSKHLKVYPTSVHFEKFKKKLYTFVVYIT